MDFRQKLSKSAQVITFLLYPFSFSFVSCSFFFPLSWLKVVEKHTDGGGEGQMYANTYQYILECTQAILHFTHKSTRFVLASIFDLLAERKPSTKQKHHSDLYSERCCNSRWSWYTISLCCRLFSAGSRRNGRKWFHQLKRRKQISPTTMQKKRFTLNHYATFVILTSSDIPTKIENVSLHRLVSLVLQTQC